MLKLPPFETIDEYIELFPPAVQERLKKIRAVIQNSAPAAEEVISYQMPTYKIAGKNLLHFAAYKGHIGFYPTPDGVGEFAQELKDYEMSKGAILFPHDQPIPYEVLEQIVHFRVEQNLARARK